MATVMQLGPGQKLSPDEATAFVEGLNREAMDRARRQVGGCEFMREVSAGTVSREALQVMWLNWHGYVAEINNIVQCAYQRHLPFFKRNLDLLAAFADNLADELTHPRPPGHMLVVWKQGEIFGLTVEQMMSYEMVARCRAYLEWFRGLLWEGTIAEFWAAKQLEEYVGYWSRQFREGLEKMGYETASAVYFTTHEEADLVEHEGTLAHTDFNKLVLRRILEQGYGDTRPGFSIEGTAFLTVDLWELFYEGVSREYRRMTGGTA
jgi:pyrroloquinoline quinone (PQQ) biosynthesis protein C